MQESSLEYRLKRELEDTGCLFYKWVSPGNAGVPDRILILPKGAIWFVEMKTDTGQLSPVQQVQARKLRARNCRVFAVHGEAQAKTFIEKVRAEILSPKDVML